MSFVRRLVPLGRQETLLLVIRPGCIPDLPVRHASHCNNRWSSSSTSDPPSQSTTGATEPVASTAAAEPETTASSSHAAGAQPKGLTRKQYAALMTSLRRQWQQELARQKEEAAAVSAAKAEEVAVKRAASDERRKRAKELREQIRVQEDLLRSKVQAKKQEQAGQWRGAVAQVYEQYRQKQEASLLEQSRHWILPDQLSARVAEALDNPVALFLEVRPEWPLKPGEDWRNRERAPNVRDYRRGQMFQYAPISRQS